MRLSPRIVTATTAEAIKALIPKEAAKKFANIDHDDDDAEIEAFVRTAFSWMQPPQGCLRVSIAEQTLRLDLPCWPMRGIELPAGPVVSVVSVKYFDDSNAEQTVSSSDYFLDNDTLIWAETFTAPTHYARPSAVQITYDAGYADDALPDPLRTAILQCVKHWYDNRDAVQAVGALSMMALGVDDLVANFRVR